MYEKKVYEKRCTKKGVRKIYMQQKLADFSYTFFEVYQNMSIPYMIRTPFLLIYSFSSSYAPANNPSPLCLKETPGENPPLAFGADSKIVG